MGTLEREQDVLSEWFPSEQGKKAVGQIAVGGRKDELIPQQW